MSNTNEVKDRSDTVASRKLSALPSSLTGKWTTDVVQALGQDVKRFHELHKDIPTTQKVLTETLRKLERSGVVTRDVYPTIPPKVEYKLTSVGINLLRLFTVISDWNELYAGHIHRAQKAYDRRQKR